jgi:hypothetical protein
MKKMMKKTRKGVAPIITTLFLVIITLSVAISASHQLTSPQKSGQLIPMAYAINDQLTKQVGENVYFKVKIENTGTVESVYLLEVKIREHGTEIWETLFLEDIVVEPTEYGVIEFGSMKCVEEMIGKHYDIKFLLSDPESDSILDEETVEQAWYVQEAVISASIIGYWIS